MRWIRAKSSLVELPVELVDAHAVGTRTAETGETGVRRAQQRRGCCQDRNDGGGRHDWRTGRRHLAFPHPRGRARRRRSDPPLRAPYQSEVVVMCVSVRWLETARRVWRTCRTLCGNTKCSALEYDGRPRAHAPPPPPPPYTATAGSRETVYFDRVLATGR